MLVDEQSDRGQGFFVPPREPIMGRIVTETPINERTELVTLATDHAALQPLPAPPTRPSWWQFAATDGPVAIADHTMDGQKVSVEMGFTIDPLQDMLEQEQYQRNTFRIEAEPWDDDLI